MTALVGSSIARTRVDRIKTGLEVTWTLVVESFEARDWEPLGYSSWDDMCTREFGTSRLRLPREERAETIESLRAAGLSMRAIASATGYSEPTVRRSLAPASYDAPAESPAESVRVDTATGEVLTDEPAPPTVNVTVGIDGKNYQRSTPRKPPRKPLTDVAKTRGFALRQATDGLLRIFEDDRYRTNEKQVADVLRGHLLYVAETVAAVLDQLP